MIQITDRKSSSFSRSTEKVGSASLRVFRVSRWRFLYFPIWFAFWNRNPHNALSIEYCPNLTLYSPRTCSNNKHSAFLCSIRTSKSLTHFPQFIHFSLFHPLGNTDPGIRWYSKGWFNHCLASNDDLATWSVPDLIELKTSETFKWDYNNSGQTLTWISWLQWK
jgi:hypothetical protein